MLDTKQVEAFFNEVKKDEGLKAKLKKVEQEVAQELNKKEAKSFFYEKLLPLAKEYGFSFSYEELMEYKKNLIPKAEELDDEILTQVAGGNWWDDLWKSFWNWWVGSSSPGTGS